jgi:microcompartment protein CcmK/EutM
MFIAHVIAPVVATEKHAFFKGRKLLLVKEENPDGSLGEKTLVALDYGPSGVGDRVLVAKNGGAVDDVMEQKDCPANVVIVGHVDLVQRQ